MIIDCHGHYTTSPASLEEWRQKQIANLANPALGPKASDLKISDVGAALLHHLQLVVLDRLAQLVIADLEV